MSPTDPSPDAAPAAPFHPNRAWEALAEGARKGLAHNLHPVWGSAEAVLTEGGMYAGIWMECGPHEALLYAQHGGDPAVAVASHRVFFRHQRGDGQFPAFILRDRVGYGQIQMAVPLAETALELVSGGLADEAFLAEAYEACARWDRWLAIHRDSGKRDLVDLHCEYDTGHDNSGRFTEDMRGGCPGEDARRHAPASHLPWQAPDLSASLYGGRVALAAMAERLGRRREGEAWIEKAGRTRRAMETWLWDAETECYYDRDAQGRFRKIVSDALLRVMMEHVADQQRFDRVFSRYIGHPEAFWTPYPFPSVAANDPAFRPATMENCWGGASQALCAMRAPRWLPFYGRREALERLMARWLDALRRAGEFRQQLDPWTGNANTTRDYTPAMCLTIDFHARLAMRGRRGSGTV